MTNQRRGPDVHEPEKRRRDEAPALPNPEIGNANERRSRQPTLFMCIRLGRARLEPPSRYFVELWEATYPSNVASECFDFARALVDHRVSDRTTIRKLAEAFCSNRPIDPQSLRGRELELAIGFYNELETDDDFLGVEGPYQAALIHAERVKIAEELAALAAPRRGNPGNSVGQIVDDFLIVAVRAARSLNIPLRVPSSEDAAERDTDLTSFIMKCFGACQKFIHRRAEKNIISLQESEDITSTLNDIIGRPLSDRLRRTIKEFG